MNKFTFELQSKINKKLILFFVLIFSGISLTNAQSISDFNKKKPISVTSTTGAPTISRAQPFKITGGVENTTGTGNIVLDWSNISSRSDIAVYDENDNLLDYYFEGFDATNETAVIWVYRDWVRDGSTQAQIAYGNGPGDHSVTKETVFDKEMNNNNLVSGWLLNENPAGTAPQTQDITSKSNNGTAHGSMTSNDQVDGIVGGAYNFDGSDDYVEIPHDNSLDITNKITISAWVKSNVEGTTNTIVSRDEPQNSANDVPYLLRMRFGDAFFGYWSGSHWNSAQNGNITKNTWHHIVGTFDGGQFKVYIDNNLKDTYNYSGSLGSDITSNRIGSREWVTDQNWDGIIDNVQIYNNSLPEDEITSIYDATKSNPDFFEQGAPLASDEVLPVELLSFNATCLSGAKAKVSWSTATEINNDHFEVQLSEDGQNFETVKFIQGMGNSNERQNYETAIDIENREQYVRLKQVDFDGQTEVFAPEYLNCHFREHTISVYPNPVRNKLTIDFMRIPESPVMISVFTPHGKRVHKAVEEPKNKQMKLDLGALSPGIYFIKISSDKQQVVRKITK